MSISKLNATEIEQLTKQFTHWSLRGDSLYRKLVFPDFISAFGFMTKIALLAERIDHHPDWRNVYNTLEITLSTHDVNGLSSRDIEMAQNIDALWLKFEQKS